LTLSLSLCVYIYIYIEGGFSESPTKSNLRNPQESESLLNALRKNKKKKKKKELKTQKGYDDDEYGGDSVVKVG
jgi:hypothetical protein